MSSLYKDPLEVQAAYGEVNPPDDDIFYHPNQLSTRRIVKRFNSWLTVRFDVVVQMRWLNLTIVWTMYLGAVAQWYSQRTSVFEVAGSTPAPVIIELLWLKTSHNLG